MRSITLSRRLGIAAAILLATTIDQTAGRVPAHASGTITAVTVGSKGNEPIVKEAPDGTLYISALQHIYRSLTHGATWEELPGPIEASTLNLNSDSSISVDPGGRLYFSFDYPYAGTTAVCVSDDKGTTFTCDPKTLPGGTDRMWVYAPTTSTAYATTNEALYQTVFFTSTDRGQTWVPGKTTTNSLQPQTGPLIQKPGSNLVLQPLNDSNTGKIGVYAWDVSNPTAVTQTESMSPLDIGVALPNDAMDSSGNLWLSSEEPNGQSGRNVKVAYSPDEGQTWKTLPPVPQPAAGGTSTFSTIAAGATGHVGVLYYYTAYNGDPATVPAAAIWSAVFAETFNATDANPTWTVTTVDPDVHLGPICSAASCMGNARFSGDFISAAFDPTSGNPLLTWNRDVSNGTTITTFIRFGTVLSPTAARVSSFTISRRHASLTFHWKLTAASGVTGFDVYAGGHRLDGRPIAVHTSSRYVYRTNWQGTGRFSLHVLLADGRQVVVRR